MQVGNCALKTPETSWLVVVRTLNSQLKYTHTKMQWAAVMTHWSLMRVPPQTWELLPVICRWMLACQGHDPGVALTPPTIFSSFIAFRGASPHSVRAKVNECKNTTNLRWYFSHFASCCSIVLLYRCIIFFLSTYPEPLTLRERQNLVNTSATLCETAQTHGDALTLQSREISGEVKEGKLFTASVLTKSDIW